MFRIRSKKDRRVEITSRLLQEVWQFTDPGVPMSAETSAYFEHYEQLLKDPSLISREETTLGRTDDQARKAIALVQKVQSVIQRGKRLGEIKNAVRDHPPAELLSPITPGAVTNAIDFALRLWLFVPVVLDNDNSTFEDALRQSLPPRDPIQRAVLSIDFNAKNLIRKGGFLVRTTSCLSQHLEMDDLTISIFRHAGVLNASRSNGSSELFPDGFLDEVEQTMQLLFPTKGPKKNRRTRKYVKEFKADLETGFEAGLKRLDQLNLERYPHFGRQLERIQQRYDQTRPRRLRQWWFDRRNRVEWAALCIAAVVLLLTVVFGIISSTTGILQVYYSKPH